MLLSALLALSLSHAAPPPPAATWVDLPQGGQVCISGVPSSGKPRGKDREGLTALITAFASADDASTLSAVAGDLVAFRDSAKPHPSLDALGVALSVALDGPDVEGADTLASAYPRDPCLQATAAIARHVRDGDRADTRLLRGRLGRAWIGGKHPEVARLLAIALERDKDLEHAMEVVTKGLKVDPEHQGLLRLRVKLSAQAGQADEALDDLLTLHAAGDHELDETLRAATYRAGRTDDYLRLAAEARPDLALIAGLDTDPTPLATLRTRLGLTSDTDWLEAELATNKGNIVCSLYVDEAPVTVASFVGLATGQQPWTDPRTGDPGEGALYDGVRFHRVIPGFMIQTGDPLGTGTGGPGYQFWDEVTPQLRFDRPGRLAMANSGPGTNGSQFFVTEAPTAHLDGKHTIFGQCATLDVVTNIAEVSRSRDDRPFETITIETIRIVPQQRP